ncbi:MAG: pyridoxal phosphate-dependent aminotransferase [Candidatus Aenigmarchaeota archaeon]|nr:pyridoxal phosphate-dependent aminotransferase [Candidatus Aenigmarchaeota archaeon]
MRIAEREQELPFFVMNSLLALAGKPGVVSLGPGEPDGSPPPAVIRAAKQALDRRETHYTPPQGRPDLLAALARKLKRENRIDADPEDVIVTNGSSEGILLTLLCAVDPGEGVLLPDPGFLSYRPLVEMLSGMPLSFVLREEQGFRYTTEALEQAIVPEKTRALILNTPSNPTGTVLSRADLEEIAGFAVEHDLLIIADEAYEKFTYGTVHVSIGSLNGMAERVVTLFSFSKSHAMPGFRLGYATGPREMIAAMTKLHLFTTLTSSSISQAAALAALRETDTVTRAVQEYGRRRDLVVRRLGEMGLPCVEPRGAFYAFPSIRRFGRSSLDVAKQLLAAKVAVVPGTEFGRQGEGYIRISYATARPLIERGMDRIERAIRSL